MENKNQHHNSFGNGFILGLLLGVIVTLIITTKKGRELFKEFTDKGLDKFSDLERKLQEKTDEIEEYDEDDYIPAEARPESKKRSFTQPVDVVEEREDVPVSSEESHKNGSGEKPKPHRFFRKK